MALVDLESLELSDSTRTNAGPVAPVAHYGQPRGADRSIVVTTKASTVRTSGAPSAIGRPLRCHMPLS
jgi:hypothetical protein